MTNLEFMSECGQRNAFIDDLVNSALREVNYYEIAKTYIEGIDKEEAA